MATVQEYFEAKLSRYNIELSDVETEAALIEEGLDPTAYFTPGSTIQIKTAIVKVLPELLLKPDITEGGYSEKWDKGAVKLFYSLLCGELNLPDVFAVPEPSLRVIKRW